MSSTPRKAGSSSGSSSTDQGHSAALGNFLANLASAYETKHGETIDDAAQSLVRALQSEKKIAKKNVEIKKDVELVEGLNSLGIEQGQEKNKE